jgi:nucleoside-diphosphate-sugar epimerase
MAISAYKTSTMQVMGPDNKLDFSYVTDVAAAFATAATNPVCANQIYNCTRGNGRRIIDAADLICARIPAKIIVKPHDAFYPNRDTLNSSKLVNETEWKPAIDIEEGINLYLDWLLQQTYLNKF